MSRAFGEAVVQHGATGQFMPGIPIDLLDPLTGVRITDTVYAAETGGTTITLPTVTDAGGRVPFFLESEKRVLGQATINGVTYTDPIQVGDPTGQKVFNVTAYGNVDSSGVADSYAAFAAALVAARLAGVGSNAGAVVVVPPGDYSLSAQLVVPNRVTLRGSNGRNTRLLARAGFPINTALVRLGAGGGAIFHSRLEHINVSCNSIAGSIGVYTTEAQEECGLFNVVVNNYMAAGFVADGSVESLPCGNFAARDCEFLCAPTATVSVGIDLIDVPSKCLVDNVSIVPNTAVPNVQVAGIRVSGSTINDGYAMISNVHVEYHTAGVQFGAHGKGYALGVESRSGTNCVTIDSAESVTVIAPIRTGTTSIAINDTNAGQTYVDTVFYSTTKQVVVPGIVQRLKQSGDAQILATSATNPYTMLTLQKSDLAANLARWYFNQDDSVSISQNILRIQSDFNGRVAFARYDGRDGVTIDTSLASVTALGAVRPGNGTVTGAAHWSGTGVPSAGMGANGDFYFRSDGTVAAHTVVYHKEAGAWVATAA